MRKILVFEFNFGLSILAESKTISSQSINQPINKDLFDWQVAMQFSL